ncbi:tRNA (guanosine(37)-N1)-methyltransferase TrmD [Candidatus Purcelliella pentastirinorum]|uniref:tRNA (guanine-N(1)-)-methyltransferase n=1 Tax=Candidatus Purcelliella pentastirinorum TaxID=472834 RepID=A0AAX3N7Q3_9ENTR|nr:tRNA (guanosine(37)-N1)-methyltransferase TrmD [Candidatus Purcelliella pentastirinorum]WDI78646.1 tRNA (guanosine(37)-N1)-methyltransferase TrmD [Candidatus Purcelliella pentastirinorum]
MLIEIISILPEIFKIIKNFKNIKRATKKKLLKIRLWNPRNYTKNKNKKIDDYLYGGGGGMLMMYEPIINTIKTIKKKIGKNTKVIYLSPKGKILKHKKIFKIIKYKKIIIVCGRYKGIDERIIETEIDEEISIGDYILSGGEIPAMVLIDCITRLIPNTIKQTSSITNDSFYQGILDAPHYTRPSNLQGNKVPSVLLKGNHTKINKWRLKQALGHTWIKRPDLLKKIKLTFEQKKLISEFKKKYNLRKKNNE